MSEDTWKHILKTAIDNVISGSPKGVNSILNFLSENFQDAYQVWVVFIQQLSPLVAWYMYTVEFL